MSRVVDTYPWLFWSKAVFFYLPITIGFSPPPAASFNKKCARYAFFGFFFYTYTALIPQLEICLEALEKIDPSRPCWGCSLKIFGKRSSQHVTVSYLPGLPASPLITLSSLRVSKLFTRSFDFFLHNTCPVTGMFWFLAFGTYVASSIFCVCDALALLESAFFLILVCAVFVWYLEILIFQFSWLKRTVWICRDLPLESSFSAIMLAR